MSGRPVVPAARFLRRSVGAAALLALAVWPALAQEEEGADLLLSGSRAPYVHRITLYDRETEAIDPRDEFAPPYSPRATCSKCHAYGQIAGGWHFNAGREGVDPGRPGEPWIWVDVPSGTRLPISQRAWPGTHPPQSVGFSDWDMILRFGRHHTGGGFAEPDQETMDASEQSARWGISGNVEIDCLVCHSRDPRYDAAERARQLESESFRWAPTAAAGFGSIRGEAKNAPDDWDPLMPPNPDRPAETGPTLAYDLSKFDSDDRVLFDLVRDPPAERCYFCHTTREVGAGAPEAWHSEGDVHLAAGMSCTDCHRHGIGHEVVRGYEGEPAAHSSPIAATLTCRGCHLGAVSEDPAAWFGGAALGRHTAPRPEHHGIPPLHFEVLTCTACHSGPWPEAESARFQTSMAHALGIASRERTDETPPDIVAPVFVRDDDGMIRPQRFVWPSYWGWEQGGQVTPLTRAEVEKHFPRGKRPRRGEEAPTPPETPEETQAALARIGESRTDGAKPVLVRAGRIHRVGAVEDAAAAARAYRWPIAHDVRPASQSLGVRGCTDCHAEDSPIYYGRVRTGAEADGGGLAAHEFHTPSMTLAGTWNRLFAGREVFKLFAIACLLIVAVLWIRHGVAR